MLFLFYIIAVIFIKRLRKRTISYNEIVIFSETFYVIIWKVFIQQNILLYITFSNWNHRLYIRKGRHFKNDKIACSQSQHARTHFNYTLKGERFLFRESSSRGSAEQNFFPTPSENSLKRSSGLINFRRQTVFGYQILTSSVSNAITCITCKNAPPKRRLRHPIATMGTHGSC